MYAYRFTSCTWTRELVPRVGPRVKLIDDQAMLRKVRVMSHICLNCIYLILRIQIL